MIWENILFSVFVILLYFRNYSIENNSLFFNMKKNTCRILVLVEKKNVICEEKIKNNLYA